MAAININKCDRCGKEARNDTQKESFDAYHAITLEVSGRGSYNWAHKWFLLCEDCMLKIGAKKVKNGERSNNDPDLRERLYDIFAELVAETQSNQQ